MWGFTAPLLFIYIFTDTLLPSATFFFVGKMFCVILGSYVGGLIDRLNRLLVVQTSLILQNITVILCAVMMIIMFRSYSAPLAPFNDTMFVFLFIALNLTGGISSLASLATEVSIAKDWTVVITRGQGAVLTEMNAIMRRIDLLCDIVSPFAISGLMIVTKSPVITLILVAVWNVVSFFPEAFVYYYVYKADPEMKKTKAQRKAEEQARSEMTIDDTHNINEHAQHQEEGEEEMMSMATTGEPQQQAQERMEDISLDITTTTTNAQGRGALHRFSQKVSKGLVEYVNGFRVYGRQQVFLASLSYVLLYFTVLSPGGLMVSFLKWRGSSEVAIGIFRGFAALSGIISTFITPRLIKRLGMRLTSLASIWLQLTCLAFCLISFFFVPLFFKYADPDVAAKVDFVAMSAFMTFLALSRCALWSFDLCETQIMQTAIAEDERGVVNGVEKSLCNIGYVATSIASIILSRPEQFQWLLIGSVCAIALAAIVYTIWVMNPKSATALAQ
eukprot:GEZU01022525.1.p1 GENE.GEZU01022525.1~~GEZU01022525.1.p1  ORF type:complete len:502 (+),score=143.45 GEZU01022525.1:440-1945(+)